MIRLGVSGRLRDLAWIGRIALRRRADEASLCLGLALGSERLGRKAQAHTYAKRTIQWLSSGARLGIHDAQLVDALELLFAGVDLGRQKSVRLLALAAPGLDGDPRGLTFLARQYRRLREHAEAERLCREALRLEPGHAPAGEELAHLLLMSGRDAELLELLDEPAVQPAFQVPILMRLAGAAGRRNKLDAAVACYGRLLDQDPANVPAFRRLARVHARKGEHDQARACREQYLKIQRAERQALPRIELRLRFALYMMRLGAAGRLMSVIRICRTTLKRPADDAVLWGGLARGYQRLGRKAQGLACVTRAVECLTMPPRDGVDASWALDVLEPLFAEVTPGRRRTTDLLAIAAPSLESEPRGLTFLARHYRRLREHAEAERLCREALRLDPGYAPAGEELAHILVSAGRDADLAELLDEPLLQPAFPPASLLRLAQTAERHRRPDAAVVCFRRLLDKDPANVPALRRLAKAHARNGEHEQARACLHPNGPALRRLAKAHARKGEHEQARASLHQYLKAEPNDIEALKSLIRHYKNAPVSGEALGLLTRAHELRPNDPGILRQLAAALQSHGRLAEALECRCRLSRMDAADVAARRRVATDLLRLGNLEDAVAFHKSVLERWPDDVDALTAMGHALRWMGSLDEAARCFEQAIGRNPQHAAAYVGLGEILEDRGEYEEALLQYDHAISADPADLALRELRIGPLMGLGRLSDGWKAARFRKDSLAFRAPKGVARWGGSATDARVMILAERGLGDDIRHATIYHEAIERAPNCTITCDPRLLPLMRRTFPTVRFISFNRFERKNKSTATRDAEIRTRFADGAIMGTLRTADACALAGDLPELFRPSYDSFPSRAIHLVADQALRARWRERLNALGPGLKVGICWRSQTRHYRRQHHYTEIHQWGPILTIPGVRFVNLQYDDCAEELAAAEWRFGISVAQWEDFDRRNDLDGVAALMSELDLILSPHTMVKELGGAVGSEVWYMKDTSNPWINWRARPGTDRDVWYPTMIHIQAKPLGNKEGLIQEVANRLQHRARGGPGRHAA